MNAPHLVRVDEGRGVWLLAWLDEAGRCVEARYYRRTTRGRLFFGRRTLQRFAPDGALLAATEWAWDRYGLIERFEIDLERGTKRRFTWRGETDPVTGQAVSQLIFSPLKPALELIAAPMGDEPHPPEGSHIDLDLSAAAHVKAERFRQAVLAELRRRGTANETISAYESLLTGGPLLGEIDDELLRRIAEETR